jgi:hypothetical protein
MPPARLSIQSSEFGPPTPSPAKECCPPLPLGPRGEIHLLAGEGEGTQFRRLGTFVLYVYYTVSLYALLC